MSTNTVPDWQEQEALQRYQLIAPLLDESLDPAKKSQMREDIAAQNDLSERSLFRYEKAYRSGGFSGLKPKDRKQQRSKKLPENFDELFAEAVQLKREVPKRSVEQIIAILELEGRVEPGVLKRSTLERYLFNAGFGVRQMQMYNDARRSSCRRFCKPHRMMLLQGDIKYGPKLPIGKNGAMKQTYLSSAIDDHSRYVVASKFYDNQEEAVVEDTFRTVILKAGKFDACYFDNGKQYIAKQLQLSLSKLGIRVRHTPVNSGKSKGKIERFHQTVDAFIREAKLKKLKTLEELNRYWAIYLEEYYHNKAHDGIREYYESLNSPVPEAGITPLMEWNRDSRALVFLDTSVVAEAFLHHEERKVDKGACISFQNRKYEAKVSLIGCTVQIAYDPAAPEVLTVSYEGMEPFRSHPVKIGSICDPKPALPESMLPAEAESSRLLDALEKSSENSRKQLANAISFGDFRKDGGSHV